MKKFDAKKEIAMMKKMYENSKGVHGEMDLLTFAWSYYNVQVEKFSKLRDFWTSKELEKAEEPKQQKKKKIVIRVKRAK